MTDSGESRHTQLLRHRGQQRQTTRAVGYVEPAPVRPLIDQNHRRDPLHWDESPVGGHPGPGTVIMPRVGPPIMAHHSPANSSYSHGAHYATARHVVRDVTDESAQATRGTSPLDTRLKKLEAKIEQLSRENAALRGEAPVVPVSAPLVTTVPVLSEQQRIDKWMDEAVAMSRRGQVRKVQFR